MEKQNKFGVKVGDVFYASYGYSMCLNSFYQVIEVLGTTKVRVRETLTKTTSHDGYGQQGYEKMMYGVFDLDREPLDKMVQISKYDKRPYIKISNYKHAYLLPENRYDEEFWFDYMD